MFIADPVGRVCNSLLIRKEPRKSVKLTVIDVRGGRAEG